MTDTAISSWPKARILTDLLAVGFGVFNIWVARNALPTALLIGLMLLTATALMLRRQAPITAFIATLPAAALVSAILGPMIALYAVARSPVRRWVVVAAALSLDSILLSDRQDIDITHADPSIMLLEVLYVLMIGAAPAALGWLAAAQHQLSVQMTELDQASNHQRQLLIAAERARERSELAREMHDVVSHQVSLIAVQAGAMQMVSADPDTRERAETIRRLGVATLDELRHMVNVLRDPDGTGQDLCPQPTLNRLPSLLATSTLAITVKGEPPADLSAAGERAIYRTIQEAITNVHKHAPSAPVTVEFTTTEDSVAVSITNDHSSEPSPALPGAGSGITGLKQRAELLGGTVFAHELANNGWKVELHLPRV
ncbi:sensor histidine kinase [Nocardia sp. NPDC004722]